MRGVLVLRETMEAILQSGLDAFDYKYGPDKNSPQELARQRKELSKQVYKALSAAQARVLEQRRRLSDGGSLESSSTAACENESVD